MVGQQLDQGAIAATLRDCCLPDALLASHQAMLTQNQAPSGQRSQSIQPQEAA
ncbi:MAG: hypothetical protein WA885_05175 [Phormidesmis sp.]